MFRRIALLGLLACCFFTLNAQESGNRKLSIETGFLLSNSDSEGLGLLFSIEPKVKIAKHTFAGAKFGFILNTNTYENYDTLEYVFDTKYDNAVIVFAPTVDYYLGEIELNENTLSPYLGLGLGYYLLYDIEILKIRTGDTFEVDVANRFGFLLRGGCEIKSLRVGIEYNFLPKANIENPDGQVIGMVDNRSWSLSIGYVIGNRKLN